MYGWLIDGVSIGWSGLLHVIHSHNSGLQVITALSLFYTISSSPLHTYTRILSLHYSHPGNWFITVSLSLQITPEVFFSQPNPFRTLILQLLLSKSRLNSIPTSYLGRLASRSPTLHFRLLFYTILLYASNNFLCPLITHRHAAHGQHGGVFTGPLPSNGYPIVACACVGGMCILSRCPVMGIQVRVYNTYTKRFHTNFYYYLSTVTPNLKWNDMFLKELVVQWLGTQHRGLIKISFFIEACRNIFHI
jgi:hypothetical protein